MSEEERVRMLQNLVVLAKPEVPTLASTPEPSASELNSLYANPFTSPLSSAVHVHVEGVPFQYTLTESDLTVVFSRFGQVRLVHINLDGSSAVVYFHSAADAQRALLELDGKSLNGIQGHLRVRPISTTTTPTTPTPTTNLRLASPPIEDLNGFNGFNGCGSGGFLGGISSSSGPVRKYTCRFEIGIENDKEFHVARRLIGPKGAQMKRILLACEGAETPKLRLRGIGSGFLEGALKQESPEPLHLCISCKDYANYRKAVDMVAELLTSIYREYAEYCRVRNINRPQPTVVYRETPLACLSPSPGFTPQPSPLAGAADLRAGWAQVAGGMSFPQSSSGSTTIGSTSGTTPNPTTTTPVSVSATSTTTSTQNPIVAASVVSAKPLLGSPSGARVATSALPPGLPIPEGMNAVGASGVSGGGVVVGGVVVKGGVVMKGGVVVDGSESGEVQMSVEERREILRLVEERNSLRARGMYEEADRIRELLRSKGVGLMDEPGGRGRGLDVTTLRFWRGTSP